MLIFSTKPEFLLNKGATVMRDRDGLGLVVAGAGANAAESRSRLGGRLKDFWRLESMPIKIVESAKSVPEIVQIFPEVCARYKFGLLGTIDIRQKLREKGVSFDRDCLIFEVCNPQAAKKVLEYNPAISAALPCRISVYRESGKTKIATILPTALLGLFPSPELQPMAQEVERTLGRIMQDLK